MAFDAGLVARIADALYAIGERTIRQKSVFGGRGFMDGKHAFVIVSEDAIIAKLAPDDYANALTEPGVAPFTPMGERAMGTWVVVDAEVVADDPELADWLKRALRGVRR
ncbi:MAG TPA: TfoX/Sxy family protein [Gemmatimonadaceae bacterium]